MLVYFNGQCSSVLCLSLTVFNVFRITWWPSARKELYPWLSALVDFILYRMCSFPIGCLGQDVEFGCIGSWSSLPFIYFAHAQEITLFCILV